MNLHEKLQNIQLEYILYIIGSIDKIQFSYLHDTEFSTDKNVDKTIKNMIMRRQQDVWKLEGYLANRELSSNIPYTDILNFNAIDNDN